MKLDLSFHLLKNSLAFHMKKGFNNPCIGDTSTSTLKQQQQQPTLEEMIMQLDLEASRPSLQHHRMSCVNSSDILQSARNALSQYPRFSLDGKDAMYRSSFRKFDQVTTTTRPSKVAGERVIWCKPGIVGKLMGLEAMPIPVRLKSRMMMSTCLLRKQNLKRSSERHVVERRKVDSNRVSCSRATTSGYNKPIAIEIAPARDGGHRFP
ncbi:hypothetical protein SSX86_029884 [Deinandra increscens subsp. villosa]|uniref:DUF3741 domain-containing protein n=1 Tax=Deinandra increscens subsp. villosa TaxID=3103831 RepID=A0AAP0GL05_9ASTR